MLVKILGVIDIVAAVMLIFSQNHIISTTFFVIFGVIMILKSVMGFFRNFGSWIDLTGGLSLILSVFFILPWIMLIICSVLVLQKGIASLI